MKVEKFKVLLYLKKSGLDKNGKAPIMGRITLNRTMAQFGCKLSCTPKLWNPRESRLDGKSKEAVGLTLTIPTWASSISRVKKIMDKTKMSREARKNLVEALKKLKNRIDEMLSELGEEENDG